MRSPDRGNSNKQFETGMFEMKELNDVEEDYEESGVEEEDYEGSSEEDSNKQFESVSRQIFDTEESNSERQRPTRSTRRPSRFRDEEFETQFRPEERRQRSCKSLGRGDQDSACVDNFCNFHKHRKKERECDRSGRGVQKRVSSVCSISNNQRLLRTDRKLRYRSHQQRKVDTLEDVQS